MSKIFSIFKREFLGYFRTPIALVFLMIFLFLSSGLTFYWGGFFSRNQADLLPFFGLLPWLLMILMPALGMRLWSEEYRSGTIELLSSLPITTFQWVMGKFLAAWCFTALCLLMTFPMWLTVNYLGSPDNGVIFASYCGAWLTAGGMLAISIALSAISHNQVMAFILSIVVCLFFMLTGSHWMLHLFKGWAPEALLDGLNQLSILHHAAQINKGIFDLNDVIYFVSLIILWLSLTVMWVNNKKAY